MLGIKYRRLKKRATSINYYKFKKLKIKYMTPGQFYAVRVKFKIKIKKTNKKVAYKKYYYRVRRWRRTKMT